MQRSIFKVLAILSLLAVGFLPSSAIGGYWHDQFDLPPILEKEPENAIPPRFESEGPHLLSTFQIMTDLGRKQMIEIDQLAERTEGVVGCYSTDRVAREWPKKYIKDFLHQQAVSIPLYSILDEGLRGLFRGYDTGRIRIFPHTLIIDASHSINQILRGVQSKENLETALHQARDPWSGIAVDASRSETNLVKNRKFDSGLADGIPEGWGVYHPEQETLISSPKTGWKGSTSLEIRSSKERDYQIAYQIIPHADLLGRAVVFSALAQSNSLGLPRAALAVPHPQVEEGLDFVPRPPLKTRSGRGIPLRIIGSLDFETDHSHWQHLSTEISIPADARALVLVLYLDNPSATGGAARFDEVGVTVIE